MDKCSFLLKLACMDTYERIRNELARSSLRNAKKRRLIAVLDSINAFIDTDDEAYVNQANLARRVGCGLTTIKKATRELEELGYLERVRTKRTTDWKYHWNVYRLICPPRGAEPGNETGF